MDPRLCGACRSITVEQLCSEQGYQHYPQIKLIRIQAEISKGCPLCSMVWKILCERGQRPSDEGSVRLKISPTFPSQMEIPLHGSHPVNICCPSAAHSGFTLEGVSGRRTH